MTTATLGRIFTSLTAGVLVLFSKDIYRLVVEYTRSSRSPLRRLPGPKPQRFLGNIKELMDPNPALVHEKWVEEHGHAFKAHSVLNIITLFLVDPRAVSYVLAHDTEYPMPAPVLRDLSRMLGDGLLVVQGEQHRRERRVMSPAFGPGQIREPQSIFLQKCTQLRDIWIQSVKSGEATRGPDGRLRAQVEATEWLNKMTLDVIGLAGFDSSFNALSSSDAPSELNQVLRTMLVTGNNPSLLDFLHAILPITRFIKSQADRNILRAREVTDRVGRELISKAKSAVTEGRDAADISRKDFEAKDMLTLLIRANMAQDVPNGAKLSDEEVISQIPTMLFAGYETTSAALACALYALACNADIQDTLCAEVLACADGDAPSVDTLNKLPYLDKFIRETLRLYSPATVMVRTATKDDVIPTGEDWADQTGVKHSGIHITKDETLMIPILAMNRSKRIWGEDAYQFKPERWANVPEAVAAIPGVWGNSLTFSGGSRACIGYRFAVAEMKTTIYTLLRSLRFSLAADPADIKISVQGITRPVIRDKPKDGAYLPLWVTVLEDEPAF